MSHPDWANAKGNKATVFTSVKILFVLTFSRPLGCLGEKENYSTINKCCGRAACLWANKCFSWQSTVLCLLHLCSAWNRNKGDFCETFIPVFVICFLFFIFQPFAFGPVSVVTLDWLPYYYAEIRFNFRLTYLYILSIKFVPSQPENVYIWTDGKSIVRQHTIWTELKHTWLLFMVKANRTQFTSEII